MRRMEENAGDCLKSILHVGILQGNLNAANMS